MYTFHWQPMSPTFLRQGLFGWIKRCRLLFCHTHTGTDLETALSHEIRH